MLYHTVQQGECLTSIAALYHLADWRRIYDHPENAEFKRQRPNPNIICPGDTIFVPDVHAGVVGKRTDVCHKFVARTQHTRILIKLLDDEFRPLSGRPYRFEIDGEVHNGTTDQTGMIEQSVPALAHEASLTVTFDDNGVEQDFTWVLGIGALDPCNQITGIQARLNNLGFANGPVDGVIGPRTQTAVRQFQSRCGITVDGNPGPQTQRKLLDEHGC